MRRVGLILLAAGLAGFLFATGQRARYDPVEAAPAGVVASRESRAREGWETTRWLLAGTALMGLILTVLPGKKG